MAGSAWRLSGVIVVAPAAGMPPSPLDGWLGADETSERTAAVEPARTAASSGVAMIAARLPVASPTSDSAGPRESTRLGHLDLDRLVRRMPGPEQVSGVDGRGKSNVDLVRDGELGAEAQ